MSDAKRQRAAALVQDMRVAAGEHSSTVDPSTVVHPNSAHGVYQGDPEAAGWTTIHSGDMTDGFGGWIKKETPEGMILKGIGVEGKDGNDDALIGLTKHPDGGYRVHPNSYGKKTLKRAPNGVVKDHRDLIHSEVDDDGEEGDPFGRDE